jgi:hypothetical protein
MGKSPKLSGARQRVKARTRKILGVRGKRGRPRGETLLRRELQKQIHEDLAWLGLPYKPDLYSYLVKKLLESGWRTEQQLKPPECPEAYERIGKRHFRREIAIVHERIWGKLRKKESRSLWQHWRHQNYRLTRHQNYRLTRDQKGTTAVGNCRRCIRGGVYVGPCYCLAREIGQQGRQDRRNRKCISCGNTFLSGGIHNRLCSECKQRRLPQYD